MSAADTRPLAITVKNLGKRYRISNKRGAQSVRDRGLGALAEVAGKRDRNAYVWAVRHVDFEVHRGEIFGVIGRNGSGKTTMLKVLAGVTSPTAGSAEIRGRVTALLQAGAGFHPELTGRDNVYLSGAIMGLSKADVRSRFEEIVDFSEIGRYLDEPVKRYSSGMYARLAFSVAAVLPAEIMLIDEVLAVGDGPFRQKAEDFMVEALHDGRSVVYVGHGLEVVRKLCDRALVLERGSVAYTGDANDAADYYEDRFIPGGSQHAPAGGQQGQP